MNGTTHTDELENADDGILDPQTATALLKQTEQQAKRDFDFDAPSRSLLGAALILIFYGSLYMAARGHDPYKGPTGPWLLAWPFGVVVGLVFNGARYGRMRENLKGATLRRVRGTAVAGVAALIGVYTVLIALHRYGVSDRIVLGSLDAAALLLALGPVVAASAAWREDWLGVGVGVGLTLVAAGATFGGPAFSWLIVGVGGCVVLLAHAGAKAWLNKR
jgi:hypothetical protein